MSSWWRRGASPMQFARMAPRERMLAGLAGLSVGSSGIEVRGLGEEFTMVQAVAPVAQPAMAAAVMSAQTVSQPAVQAVAQPALQPALTPYSAPAPMTMATSTANATPYTGGPALTPYSAPPPPAEPPRFAAGRAATSEDIAPGPQDEVWEGTAGEKVQKFAREAPRVTPVQKAPGPSGIVNLRQEAASMSRAGSSYLGIPQWAWVVGGLSAALVVLYKVAK